MENIKLDLIKKKLEEMKAEDISVYDVSTSSPLCSYIVVATILNPRHGNSLVRELLDIQEKLGENSRSKPSRDVEPWLLVDLNDIIVHLFTKEERARIDLDSLIRKINLYE